MSRLGALFILLFCSCSNLRMANVPSSCASMYVLPVKTSDGALLQRLVATQLIEAGYCVEDSDTANVLCRVNVLDDSCDDISKSFTGKVQRASHNINFEVFFEDSSGNEILKPFKISSSHIIGYINPDNTDSLHSKTGNDKINTFDFSLGQSKILDESQEVSRQLLFEQLANRIVMHLQATINEKSFKPDEVSG